MAKKVQRIKAEEHAAADPRLGQILDVLIKMGAGEFGARLDPGDASDEVDGIITGINMIAEELEAVIEELHHKVDVLSSVADIDREIILKRDPQAIMDKICQRTAELLGAPMALLVTGDEPGSGKVAAVWGIKDANKLTIDSSILAPSCKIDGKEQFTSGAALFSREAIPELLGSWFQAEAAVQTAALAPVMDENRVFGSLLLLDTRRRLWSEDEMELLGMLAGQTAIALDGLRLFIEERSRRAELKSLYELSRALIDCEPAVDAVLDLVVRHAAQAVHVTFVQAVLLEDGVPVPKAAFPVRMIDRNLLAGYENPAAAAYLKGMMRHDLPVVVRRDEAPLTESEKSEIFRDVAQVICVAPLRGGQDGLGLIIFAEARREEREPFTPEKLRLAAGIADQTVSALRRVSLIDELESSYLDTVLALANAIDAKDSYTGGHGRRMAEMALALGRRLGLTPAQLSDLRYGALLHDVGKIGVPDSILLKPGSLDDREWRRMKGHSAMGEKIIFPVRPLRGAAALVRHHHERYDGSGYPDKLAGDEIPLGARILTVVDSFSAMMDKRSYKEAFSVNRALAELNRCSGSQFDPRVVQRFRELWEAGEMPYSHQK